MVRIKTVLSYYYKKKEKKFVFFHSGWSKFTPDPSSLSLSSARPLLSLSLQFLPPAFVPHLCLQFSSDQRPLQLLRFPPRRPPATVTAQPPSHRTPITIALRRSLISASTASISSDGSVSCRLLSRRFSLSLSHRRLSVSGRRTHLTGNNLLFNFA